VVSAFCLFFALIGVPSLVIGIIALTKARTEPADARRLTWIGWVVLGVLFLLLVVFFVIVIAIAVSSSSTDDGTTIGTLGTTLPHRALRST
jgi:4-amino-4-deoxy-L-arabinose transferase-like glycosyltransferase